MARQRYPTDLTDDEWRVVEPLLPPAKPGGRPRRIDVCEVMTAVRSLRRSGCSWRLPPHEVPRWPTVSASCRRWEAHGTWERIAGCPRRDLRVALGRKPEPSAAILDRPRVKTTETGGLAATTPARS